MNRAWICLTLGLAIVLATSVSAQQTKVIKDQAEYNAYIAALNTPDPAARAAAMEAFVAQYPNSVVKIDALEQAMAAYQQALNQPKVMEKAKQILAVDGNNVQALAIVTAIDRAIATEGGAGAAEALKEGCGYAQTGLQQLPGWQKPESVTDADFQTLRAQMGNIFNGAAGFCALQNKDYANARAYYEKATQKDLTNWQDVFQLAVAELEMTPLEVKGFWYCAKAVDLAQRQNNTKAAQGMMGYCKPKYKRYHGGEDGWELIQASAAKENAPPAGLAVKPAPTPCDLAVQAVQENDPAGLSFGDKEFILSKENCSPANKEAASKVWKSIQDMEKGGEARLQIPVKVISATKTTIEAAIIEENQPDKKADLHVELEKPVVKPPAPGTTTKVTGVITKYTIDPFMFTMEKGALPAVKAPPKRHSTATKTKKKQ
jgi:tetratricopeptide (TPR) repeat protein